MTLEENFVFENSVYRKTNTHEEHKLTIERRERSLKKEFETLLIAAKATKVKLN